MFPNLTGTFHIIIIIFWNLEYSLMSNRKTVMFHVKMNSKETLYHLVVEPQVKIIAKLEWLFPDYSMKGEGDRAIIQQEVK